MDYSEIGRAVDRVLGDWSVLTLDDIDTISRESIIYMHGECEYDDYEIEQMRDYVRNELEAN